MQTKLQQQSKDPELKKIIKGFNNIDFNIGLSNVKSNTTKFIELCNLIKQSNPEFSLETARNIFQQSFKHLFKNQEVPMSFIACIIEQDGKFAIDRKYFYK